MKHRRLDSPGDREPPGHRRDGFTLVEIVIALVILACGLLGMAGTTALVVRQVNLSDLATERTAALQTAIERLRAMPYDSVGTGADSVGIFRVEWSVTASTDQSKSVRLITTGPGMSTGPGRFPTLSASVPDTLSYRILKP